MRLKRIFTCLLFFWFRFRPVPYFDYEGLITAAVSLEIRIVSSKKGTIEDSFNISQTGAGYTKLKAEETAVENVLNALAERLSKSLSTLAD